MKDIGGPGYFVTLCGTENGGYKHCLVLQARSNQPQNRSLSPSCTGNYDDTQCACEGYQESQEENVCSSHD